MPKISVPAPVVLRELAGSNIRELRRERGMTQKRLAELVGEHPPYICQVELGRANLTLATLARIAEVLEVEPYELLMPKQED